MNEAFDAIDRAQQANAEARPVKVNNGVVTRPASPATVTIQSFLRFLRSKDVDGVPEPLGADDTSETLRYLPGESGGDAWYHQHSDEGLASAARLLRRIHDAGRSWDPPTDAIWGAPTVPADDVVYCHGDPGPWNFVWQDNEAVGLIDWDYLHPGSRLDDVAYALQWFVPMRSDELALDWHHFPEVPDRRHRLEVFLQAYGELPDFDVVDAVADRMAATRDLVRQLAESGQEPQQTWVRDGALDRYADEIDWLLRHRDLLAPPAEVHRQAGLLIVISGPTAAGKTTIGHEVAARRDRAIHIDGDFIQGLVVSGSITMGIPPAPGALDQLRLRFRAALTIANLYRDAGFDAILSDNLFAEEAEQFIASALDAHPSRSVHFVMLHPSVEAIRERYDRRPGGGYTDTLTPEVLKDAVERTAHVGLWLDTSNQTPTLTADELLRRLPEAELDPGAIRDFTVSWRPHWHAG